MASHRPRTDHNPVMMVSCELGNLVQRDIVNKGNLKLAQAREMGIHLRDMVIGDNLLPTWKFSWETDEEVNGQRENDAEPAPESDLTDSQRDNLSVNGHSESATITPVSDIFDSSVLPDTPVGSPISQCDTEVDDDIAEDYGQLIEMSNLVALEPTYEEPEDFADNVIHNVQVFGAPLGSSSEVDLEVYLVEEDDISHLPEVELAIDREAFEFHFGNECAIDVHIPGARIFSMAASDEDETEAECFAKTQRPTPIPLFTRSELYGENILADREASIEPEHSEEVTEDELEASEHSAEVTEGETAAEKRGVNPTGTRRILLEASKAFWGFNNED
ncbi:hypothetical protein DCS_04104 [Drechmeria coniospora]|uniref:Uncharacterized protein n=1 Tax=Drechmeria coniospora TaxID=98403 RepID=A0A151GJ23_DRECN|nr:hypothetical protein DCS_04104 [Drechmeria coniospora]KYK57097.1 hypothetical protein DCS_04104 [Drechmeria coniospora]